MKKVKAKNLIKQIICIMLILMLCNFILPNYTFAVKTEKGGSLMEVIAQFLCFIPDSVMNILQDMFIVHENIKVDDDTYSIKYSPGVIFSGQVPALDINFINPSTETKNGNNYGSYVRDNIPNFFVKRNTNDKEAYEKAKDRKDRFAISGGVPLQQARETYTAYYWVENDTLYIACRFDAGWLSNPRYKYYYTSCPVSDQAVQESSSDALYGSIANELQATIATWYNALRRIALVGLLSALVYVGIRIVLSSTSAKEKAKYKSMLKDWLVAICLLFTLHYIMSITITVVNEISNIFATGESDVLVDTLRGEIFSEKDRGIILAKTIMYLVIVVLTVIFTVQYLKRVIFMAFYTLIAPLITLTYPLDKIKDGQAQAFTMWIREYVYTALTQVIHLIIYTVMVGSALDIVSMYPLYAIIVMLFIKKADGIIKKMFGFDKSETVGSLGAAATGALVVNALNKIARKRRFEKK